MKKPSKIVNNLLLGVIVLLVFVLGVVAIKGYGRIHEELLAREEAAREAEKLTPEPTQMPTAEPTPDPNDPAVQKENLLKKVETALSDNDVAALQSSLRYTGEDGSILTYGEEDVAAVMLHLKKTESDYHNFLQTLQADITPVGSGEEGSYLLLSEKNLRKMTNTAEPMETLTAEKPLVGQGRKVAIDAGHQGKGNSELEPIGPGALEQKAKVAAGTTGRATGVPEYQLNLDVSLKLKGVLESRGYEVYMIRESNEVNISNAERAQLAAASGADILVRIHANGSENTSVSGALTMAPSLKNPYVGSDLAGQCQKLSEAVIQAFCASTGANNQGVYQTDEMSGLNWCTIPATIVELGYMTNPEEDTRMQDPGYQDLMVEGIANGIDQYFAAQT